MKYAPYSPLKAQLSRLLFSVLPAFLALQTAHSAEPFEFTQNDVVAIYGNGHKPSHKSIKELGIGSGFSQEFLVRLRKEDIIERDGKGHKLIG